MILFVFVIIIVQYCVMIHDLHLLLGPGPASLLYHHSENVIPPGVCSNPQAGVVTPPQP